MNVQDDTMKEDNRLSVARNVIDSFADALSGITIDDNFSKIIDEFLNCKGKIIVSGVGKAGNASQKFSSLLCSLGFPSCFLNPLNASHGDIGVIGEEDVLFVFSVSGKTREVLEIIDLARNINVKTIIGITSHKDSLIKNKVDFVLDMGEIEEAGELGLAPTTSILVMLAITDSLALVASEELGFTKEDYSKYHHSGYLGKKARGEE